MFETNRQTSLNGILNKYYLPLQELRTGLSLPAVPSPLLTLNWEKEKKSRSLEFQILEQTRKLITTPKCEIKTYGIDNTCDLLDKDVTVTNTRVDFKVIIDNNNE